MDFDDARDELIAGQRVADQAESLRARLRRRLAVDHPRRVESIQAMLEAIDAAMKPIRSHMGRLMWHDYPEDIETLLPEVSAGLQAQRRQLKKMLPR